MKKEQLLAMTDDELLVEKLKLKKSKIFNATLIGFLAGIVIFGFAGWISSEKNALGFLIPMFFPIFFMYRLIKNSKKNKPLEDILKERNLN
ncbi:hypothetical protein [uncultured Croceitalea sp.]|uniref:hypothetical protein n=1 Tax=uncultured Croceitalea sp. TaxID=1798908 RepID=UPI003305E4D4